MKVHFRLSDKDREKYGGDEWVVFDSAQLADLGYDQLAALEKPLRRDDTSIAQIVGVEFPETSMLGVRGVVWLARQAAGMTEPNWPDFKPNTLLVSFRFDEGDDADPLTGGSSEPPSAKTAKANTARSKTDSES